MKLSFAIGVWNPCSPFPIKCASLDTKASCHIIGKPKRTCHAFAQGKYITGCVKAAVKPVFVNEMQKRRNLLLNHDTRPNSEPSCFLRVNNRRPHTLQGKMFGKTYPSAIKSKSANPCTITVRKLFSITLGSTVNAGGKLWSPFGNTLMSAHSAHCVSIGAWIASLTSRRLK